MLNLILAEAELELIPSDILNHPSVRKNAEKRGKKGEQIVLDASLHHQAAKKLPDGERRGRPDISHVFLLLALDSIACQEGKLQPWIHTRNDQLIKISTETRLPKNYNRFIGLIESLFQNRVVPSKDKPLLRVEEGWNLQQLVEHLNAPTICLSPEGKKGGLGSAIKNMIKESEDITIIIGGFPEGDFHSPVNKIADETISLYDKDLKVWTVTSKAICTYENVLDRL